MYHVLKYPIKALDHLDRTRIVIFKGSALLKINRQNQNMVIWIASDKDECDTEEIEIIGMWTGKPFEIDEGFHYFDTVIDYLGLVWHFYVKRDI